MYLYLFLFLFGLIPLGRAWLANRQTALVHAVNWALVALVAWGAASVWDPPGSKDTHAAGYLALGLTGGAGIAVLGCRRPHAGVWNFVVLGLLAVMVLPLAENLLTGPKPLGILRIVFVGSVLAVGVLNYLPTCFGLAAVLLGLGAAGEMVVQLRPEELAGWPEKIAMPSRLCLLLVPWLAWWGWRRQPLPASVFDQRWLAFRNRYGLFWAQRVRDQFNKAAYHGHWPVRLYWQGLLRQSGMPLPQPPAQTVMVDTLRALLQRFE